jgi:hypothetical protein
MDKGKISDEGGNRVNKHRFWAAGGLALLILGAPQLSLEWSIEAESIFSIFWMGTVGLATAAHFRRIIEVRRFEQRREEARRRLKWMEAARREREVRSVRRIRAV